MMEPNWLIVTTDGETIYVQAMSLGVTPDGSLLAFTVDPLQQQPVAIRGFAPGQWKSFSKSNVALN